MNIKKYLGAQDAVKEFMSLNGQTIVNKPTVPSRDDIYLRCRLILEETTEFLEANLIKTKEANNLFQYLAFAMNELEKLQNEKVEPIDVDMVEVIDAITDIEYINLGTANTYGFNVDEAFEIVHKSNMSKMFPDGTFHRNEFGKVIKPDTYTPPDLSPLFEDKNLNLDLFELTESNEEVVTVNIN